MHLRLCFILKYRSAGKPGYVAKLGTKDSFVTLQSSENNYTF